MFRVSGGVEPQFVYAYVVLVYLTSAPLNIILVKILKYPFGELCLNHVFEAGQRSSMIGTRLVEGSKKVALQHEFNLQEEG